MAWMLQNETQAVKAKYWVAFTSSPTFLEGAATSAMEDSSLHQDFVDWVSEG